MYFGLLNTLLTYLAAVSIQRFPAKRFTTNRDFQPKLKFWNSLWLIVYLDSAINAVEFI